MKHLVEQLEAGQNLLGLEPGAEEAWGVANDVSSWRRRCWARRLGTRGPWPCARRPAGALKPPDASWVAVWKLPRMAEEKLPGTRGAGEVSGQPFNHCCGCKFLETIK